jgi:PKD repeat protein
LSVAALAVLVVALMTISPIFYSSYGEGLASNASSGDGPTSNVGSVDGNPLFAKFSTNIQTRAAPSCFTIADLNNDGLPDIAVGYSNNKSLDIFFQTQDGNFTRRIPIISLPEPVAAMGSADMDRDGLQDLVIGYNRNVTILYQKNSFSTTLGWKLTLANDVHDLAIADFNNNGRPDIAVLQTKDAAPESTRIDFLYDDGAGSYFTQYSVYPSGMERPRHICAGDFDNNGYIDIAVSDEKKGIVAAYINNNSAGRWDPVPPLSISNPVGIAIEKFDGSNNFELAVASRGLANDVEIWKFKTPTTPFDFVKGTVNANGINGFADYDLNDDAYSDIAICSNTTSDISVFGSPANQGTAYPITPQAIFPAGADVFKMTGEDINGDGKEDLVVGSTGSASNGSICIYYREGTGLSNANDDVFTGGLNQTGLATGDFNGDGKVEVVSLDNAARHLLFVNTTALMPSFKTFSYNSTRIVSGHLASSTSSDIVITHPDNNKISIYFGGPAFFSTQAPSVVIDTVITKPRSLALGDINGDGLTDIVIGCEDGILILINTGSYPYFASDNNMVISQPGASFTWVGVGDFNNGTEGAGAKLNDVFGTYRSNRVIVYFQQNQPIGFTRTNNLTLVPASTGSITWAGTGRINGDGLSDLVIGLTTNRSVTYLQSDAYTYGLSDSGSANKVTTAFPAGFSQASLGDLNDDGRDEFAVVGSKINTVTAFAWVQGRYVPFTDMTAGAGRTICLAQDANGDGRPDMIASSEISGSISFIYQRNMAPRAGFSLSPPSPYEGQDTTFDASATTDGFSDMPTMTYEWLFDGSVSRTGMTTTYAFRNNSEFQTHAVQLTVRDRSGLSDTTTRTINVQDTFPVANFHFSPSAPLESGPIQFTDVSTSSTGPIAQWHWDFGDGTTSAERDPVHTFYFNHTYSVSLTVNESDGSPDTCIKNVNISSSPPSADFSATAAMEGLPVTFTDTGIDARHAILWREWDFGDGTAKVNTSSVTTVHTYNYSGTFVVTLRLQNNESAMNWSSKALVVADRPSSAHFDASSLTITENGTIHFTDGSTTYPKDHIVRWDWSFGDGYGSEAKNPDHTFPLHGIFQVVLRVMCNDSTAWSVPYDVTVNVLDIPPTSNFTVGPGIWYEGNNSIQLTDLSTSYWLDPITGWSWDFGDGSSSSERNPAHTYRWAGTYVVELTVRDSDGISSGRTTASVHIGHAIPTASIQVITPRPYVVGDIISFQSVSTSGPDHIVRVLWESNGETGDQSVFRHQFNANSNFSVKLTVWSNDSVDGSSATVFVDLEPSGVSIGTSEGPMTYAEDSTVTLVAAATRSPTDPIVGYVWDLSFGTDFVPQPVRTENSITWHFHQSGSYLIKVRVYDSDGYTEASAQITILESDPVPAFAYGNLNSAGPVWFNANQTHDTPSDEPLLRFRWNFGDGSPWSQWGLETTTSHTFPGDGNYTVVMQVMDDSGKVVPLTRSLTVDRSPPLIEIHSPVSRAYLGDPILIFANVSDAIGVQQVVLVYSIGNQTFVLQMTPVNQEGTYMAEIPAQNSSVNLSYAISAVDVSGMKSPLSQSFQIVLSQRPTSDPLWAAATLAMLVVAGLLAYAFATKPVVDEVFVIYQDGSLLSHDTRNLKPGMDDQILGSMLIALQSFVKDSFKDESMTDLKRMEFGEKRILVERDGPVFLAVILRGRRDGKATSRMRSSLADINERFGEALSPWDGDLEKVRGVKDSVKPLVSRKRSFGKW